MRSARPGGRAAIHALPRWRQRQFPVTLRMVDILEMKQRVAATEEKIKAANEKGEEQSKRLLDLLQAVEANLSRKQNEIKTLRAEQIAAKDEIEQLRAMLDTSLGLAETSQETRPSLPKRDLMNLLKRLDEIVQTANRDFVEPNGDSKILVLDDPKPPAKRKKRSRGKGFKRIFS